jgi:hypothetical protein
VRFPALQAPEGIRRRRPLYGLPRHGWIGQAVRPGRGVLGVVVAAQIVDVVWHVAGRRRALRLCRRPRSRGHPCGNQAGDDDRRAVILRNRLEQPLLSARLGGTGSIGISPAVTSVMLLSPLKSCRGLRRAG